ncbi:hypothetical protein F7725_014129 [Dissostichus mawsoni]|uniref:C2H2-type domain-containing protein n=1 Tax=Dissostichus mawsoni TaxID=36200 RepID=A0A7J5YXA7_DISMA|nr:hypothetical protein F7725_014129 [Dissostichus mawsoni]
MNVFLLQIHSQMRRHCCPECGKTFCQLAHLQSHMEVHSKPASSYQHHQGAQDPYQHSGEQPVDDWDSGIDQTTGIDGMLKPVPPPLSHIPESIADSEKSNETEEKSHDTRIQGG